MDLTIHNLLIICLMLALALYLGFRFGLHFCVNVILESKAITPQALMTALRDYKSSLRKRRRS